jgi:REP-associated tyrosine transposase
VRRAAGRVWGDRYHARALSTPRAVHHALVYVLMNFKKHSRTGTELDPCSSAAWFSGWGRRPTATHAGAPPVAVARTWLARVGWLRYGPIDPAEQPKTG